MDDLISKRFGRLTVIDFEGIHTTPCGTRRKMWRCRCECGNESVVAENNLKNGTTKSCGYWKYEKFKERNTLHGGSNDRLYGIWKSMKRRCNSQKDSRDGQPLYNFCPHCGADMRGERNGRDS